MCSEGKISGAIRESGIWKIPLDANKPEDGRIKKVENILEIIYRKKELDSRRPLKEGKVERLMEEFTV